MLHLSTSDQLLAPRSSSFVPAWLREPLLHFLILGALLFGIDRLMLDPTDNSSVIVVGADVDDEAERIFQGSRGRQPNSKELTALRQVWLDNEVLYREGLSLGVDKGDAAIRERVIFKALSLIDANVKLPPLEDEALRSWFESRRDKYEEPARYSFQEAVLAGDASEATVSDFAKALNAGAPGDAQAGLRVFKDRPYQNLVQSYGAEFPKALEDSLGKWRALRTKDGWRAMRLDAISPAKSANYEILRGVVLQDWKDAVASEQRTAAVRQLARKYVVKFEADAK
jgi:hypothetical protein